MNQTTMSERFKRVVLWQPATNESFFVQKDGISIGRSPENDLTITCDRAISRLHAVISYGPSSDRFFIEDSRSINGTTVNGQFVRGKYLLCSGDRIALGGTILVFWYQKRGWSAPSGDCSHWMQLAMYRLNNFQGRNFIPRITNHTRTIA